MQYNETKFDNGENKITMTLLDEPMERGLIGMISSPIFKNDIALVVDEDHDIEYDFACMTWAENGDAPRVLMIEEFYDELKKGSPIAKAVIMHEVGHYYNRDDENNPDNNDDDRIEHVIQDSVCLKEIKADAFAVQYLGKNVVVEGLRALKSKILTDYVDYDEESVQLAIREIEMRINLILKS